MKKPVIIFDGVCNLCNKSVQFIIRHDPDVYFMFAPYQSTFGDAIVSKNNLNTGEPESLLLIED